jgi:trk system potassium uptake protein TrkA
MSTLRNWFDDLRQGDKPAAESVLVVGLGRFGTALATTLEELGVEVMAIDTDPALVNKWADRLTHVAVADGSSTTALNQLGAADFDAAVVAIGTGIEASVLATAALGDVGCQMIWAKAITDEHRRILERVGAHQVVQPEKQMGERVAHVVTGQVVDYFKVDEYFVLAEVKAPTAVVGETLSESGLRQKYGVTVVSIKSPGEHFTYATSTTVVGRDDLLVVAGTIEEIERFVRLRTD